MGFSLEVENQIKRQHNIWSLFHKNFKHRSWHITETLDGYITRRNHLKKGI